MPICVYSGFCQPVTRFTPKRPPEIESMVDAMRATMAGGRVRVAAVANNWILLVTAARPAMSVKDSRLCSQNSVLPPKPRSLIIDSAKSKP